MYDSLSRFADDEVNLSVCEYSFVESHCSTVENFHYCQTCESHPAKKKKKNHLFSCVLLLLVVVVERCTITSFSCESKHKYG